MRSRRGRRLLVAATIGSSVAALLVLVLVLVATAPAPAAARTTMKIPLQSAPGKPVDAETFRRELTAKLGHLAVKSLRKLYTDRGGQCDGSAQNKKRCASKKFLVRTLAKQLAADREAALNGDIKKNEPTQDDLKAAHRELGKVSLADFGAMLRDAAADDAERASLTDDMVRRMYEGMRQGLKDPSSIKRMSAKDGAAAGGRGERLTLPSERIASWLGFDREGGPSWGVVAVLAALAVLQVRLVRSRLRQYGWKALFLPTGVVRRWNKQRDAAAAAAAAAKAGATDDDGAAAAAAATDAELEGLAKKVAGLMEKCEAAAAGGGGGGGEGGAEGKKDK